MQRKSDVKRDIPEIRALPIQFYVRTVNLTVLNA
jgi:hypothetical protein